jgi:acyl phosphate:glycerol-3-phosphate acyltransferase
MPWMDQLRSADWAQAGWIALAAYSLGCFTAGYYVVRCWTGQDLRDLGSGSLGARNAGRVLGWRGFILTLLLDFGKGLLAIWVASHFSSERWLQALAMLCVVGGHLWPVQLRFEGGKGVAASLGALLVYDLRLAFAFVLIFAGAFAFMRKTVLPALFAYACLPAVAWLGRETYNPAEPVNTFILTMVSALVLFAHRRNIHDEFLHYLERRRAGRA